jgi:glycerol kinase
MRVDGSASVMDLLCQFQADLLGVTVQRTAVQETTALGAAYLAGIAEGIWPTPADAAAAWRAEATFEPTIDAAERTTRMETWHRAIDRSRAWAME